MSEPCTPDALLEAVRGLRVAEPDLGFKPLLAKLRKQQPDLGAATKEVRVALAALKAETKSDVPLPEQKKSEAPNLVVPVTVDQAASLPEQKVSHASVR